MKNKFWFLTKLSFKKKVATKWFAGAQILMLIVIVGLMNLNSIIAFFGGDFSDETTIFVVDNTDSTFALFELNFDTLNNGISSIRNLVIEQTDNLDLAKEEILNSNNLIIQINANEDNFIKAYIISDGQVDAITLQLITSSLNTTKSQIALHHMDISLQDLELIYSEVELTHISLNEDADSEDNRAMILSVVATIVGIPIFMISIYLISMIGAEINEEKSTRSMEIIVSNVSAKVHFFAKLLAVNAFALLQSGLLVLYSVIALLISRSVSDTDITGGVGNALSKIWESLSATGFISQLWYIIPLIILMLVLTFLAYSLLAGILASMTTNMEDFQQLQTPVIMISLVGYYFALAATAFDGAVFIQVASYVPLISAILAPGLLAAGYTTIVDFTISLLLLVGLCFILIKFGLRIYKVGILNYSSDKLWTKIFKATKDAS